MVLFFSFFKSLVGWEVTVEMKNNLVVQGTLHSVDQYLNMKLNDIAVTDLKQHPHMAAVKNCYIRGSVIRYVHLPPGAIEVELLQAATRREIIQTRRLIQEKKLQKREKEKRKATAAVKSI